MTTKRRLMALMLAVALFGSACGGSDSGSASDSGSSDSGSASDSGDSSSEGGGDSGDGEVASCTPGQVDGDLALYNWSEYIDPEQLAAFESEFGVKATMDTYESNEAMFPVIDKGGSGYDLIVPSDYMVGIMIQAGSIQPLNFDAIPNASNLSDDFKNPSYDPEQKYSLPYQWGYTGLAVDTSVLGTDFERSWSLVFGETANANKGKITLLNDPRETMGAALKYLGYSLNTTSQEELDQAEAVVAAAASNVIAFDTSSADEYLTKGESAIAHGYSGDLFTQFLETDDPARYVFFVPEEGGTRWIDNMSIPSDAPHPCTAHTFINWLYEPEQGAALSNWNYYGTPNKAALDLLEPDLKAFLSNPDLTPGGKDKIEEIADTGDFETNYTDAFARAIGG